MRKELKMKFKGIAPILLGSLMLTYVSCSTESSVEEDLTSAEVISSTELKYSDETEMVSEELMAIAEDVYTADEIGSTSKMNYTSGYMPDCVIVSVILTQNTKEVVLDFGEGCELSTGNTVSGTVNLSCSLDLEAASNTIEMTLDGFTFNEVAIDGEAQILRVRSNENGNPQGTSNGFFEATWPSGETASFTGTRTREWIEGYGSGFWGDNVFLITGKRTYIGREGNEFVKEVTTPLRRELSCRFIVSGVLEISRLGNSVSLDFGDGSCDAKGTLTYSDGAEEEVVLRRFRN